MHERPRRARDVCRSVRCAYDRNTPQTRVWPVRRRMDHLPALPGAQPGVTIPQERLCRPARRAWGRTHAQDRLPAWLPLRRYKASRYAGSPITRGPVPSGVFAVTAIRQDERDWPQSGHARASTPSPRTPDVPCSISGPLRQSRVSGRGYVPISGVRRSGMGSCPK